MPEAFSSKSNTKTKSNLRKHPSVINKICEAQWRSSFILATTPIKIIKYDAEKGFETCSVLEEMIAFRTGIFAAMLAKQQNVHVGVYVNDRSIQVIPMSGKILDHESADILQRIVNTPDLQVELEY